MNAKPLNFPEATSVETIEMLERAFALLFQALKDSTRPSQRAAGAAEYDSWGPSPGTIEYDSWSVRR